MTTGHATMVEAQSLHSAEVHAADEPSGGPSGLGSSSFALTLRWLIHLRWFAFATHLVLLTGAVSTGFLRDMPIAVSLAGLVGLGIVSNLAVRMLEGRGRLPETRALLASLLGIDVVLLVSMLGLTGGPANPFTVVLLVNITLAAVTVGARWTWLIVAVALIGYSSLFFRGHVHTSDAVVPAYASHLAGMWLAFVISAVGIAVFVTRLNQSVVASQRRLAALERQAARDARLAALTTTVSGAAHELATPLGTIAVAAGELERAVHAHKGVDLGPDVALIRSEVDRCRRILDQMSGRASGAWLDNARAVAAAAVVGSAAERLTADERQRLDVHVAPDAIVTVPVAGLTECLVNLLRNAFDASQPDASVSIAFEERLGSFAFSVSDRGVGMTQDVIERAGEPFFTTKPHGHGLGLFLVRQFAERHGARLIVASRLTGTQVSLEFAAA